MAEIRLGRLQWGPQTIVPIQREVRTRAGVMMQAAGIAAVAYLRSKTSELRPSWRGSGPRPAHPGHWADRTGILAASYGFSVEDEVGIALVVLTMWNVADYAIYLELHEGFYVLTGFFERSGPGWKFIREAAKLAGFKIVEGPQLESGQPSFLTEPA